MRMSRSGLRPAGALGLPLLLAVSACLHRSPEDQILGALSSARVKQISCPNVDGEAVRRSLIGAKVDTVFGDTAFADVFYDCASTPQTCPAGLPSCFNASSGVVRVSTNYLLVRRGGRWKVERPISGGISAAP